MLGTLASSEVFPRLQDHSLLLVRLVETLATCVRVPDLAVHFGITDMLQEEATSLFNQGVLVVLGPQAGQAGSPV